LKRYGVSRIALVTGGASYDRLPQELQQEEILRREGIESVRFPVSGEPSPEGVDRIRDAAREKGLAAVLAVGGGSVMDAGKAAAAMLHHEGSVAEYLEGVGDREPHGVRSPLIAVPTTAGTGSEATKNAVISRTGEGGFKKSLRHDAFVPDAAVLDPELTSSCPPGVTAAAGLDAVTQLLEAYVSNGATPFTDVCALDGLARAGRWLERAVFHGEDLEARAQMAYAAYLSGVALASAGLGVVHGAAGVLGGMRPVPHGVACGTLLKRATERVLRALRDDSGSAGDAPLERYTRAAEALTGGRDESAEEVRERCLELLEEWTERFEIPRLGHYGFTAEELESAAEKVKMKSTPVELDRREITELLLERL
jgi:alcohol dehydrogenase class IV